MPERIRAKRASDHARLLRTFLSGLGTIAGCGSSAAQPLAPSAPPIRASLDAVGALDPHQIASLAVAIGAIGFAVFTAVLLVRARAKSAQAEARARGEIAALQAEVDRAVAVLCAEPQVLVVWGATDTEEPQILGDTAIITVAPIPRRVLAFGGWLPPEAAQRLEQSVNALRARGEGFAMTLTALTGRFIEAEGRAIGGRVILRLKDVSGAKRALAELSAAHAKLTADIEPLRSLLHNVPAPIWTRDAAARLSWVNAAYAKAVEAADPPDAVAKQAELLDRAVRDEVARARANGGVYSARLPVIAAGQRRVLDILEIPADGGSAGLGIDVSEVETLKAELANMMEAHRRTLDQLPTAVAIFSAGQRLTFSNAAYRALWDLDPAFLEQHPTEAAVLDRLRAARKLPEQADYRQWRTQLFEAYRALEPQQHWWHLPDGRTLRVITTPNPEGGITYVFDDVTERLELERRYDALIRVQRETLENLTEAVAVFGSDGRLRLYNTAFAALWRLSGDLLATRPHIESVVEWSQALYAEAELWQALRGAITGLERRDPIAGRMERRDGTVIDCTTVPLPDGATLVCFQDVTDTVNVERVLRERNDALEAADQLKNDFVHHVSYELRTPLTNIIGFAHLLHDISIGPLTDKQREYLGYISSSSAALLAIINDILDLASIDAGAMKLDLGFVDIRKTMTAAAEGVRDRLAENALKLDISAPADIGSFTADERRVRQILFNLLSNAIAFSPAHTTITLSAERQPDRIVFSVADRGRGIPKDILDRVFNRFETHALGSQHRGAGLGLSIVRSFVELHGGQVVLDSVEGRGTTVSCIFPLEQTVRREAA